MQEEKKLIHECPTVQAYFHEVVNQALKNQKIETDEHVAFYLVNLLSRFTDEKTILRNSEGQEMPLALLFCQAQIEAPNKKIQLLRYLGDFSLFVSGFFQDSLNRKIVDVDYYVKMGEGAYFQLSSSEAFRQNKELFSKIFTELSLHFVQWMDVISEVSEKGFVNRSQDLLRLYEKWVRTGSERLKSLLTEQGVIPVQGLKSEFIQ